MFLSRVVRRWLVAVVLGSLVAALLLNAQAQTQRAKGKKYALLVGVRTYSEPSLAALNYTENDVEELAELLGKSGYEEIVLLTTKEGKKRPAARPTAANIRKQLHRLLSKVNKHDVMLVALSGHGLDFRVTVNGKKKNESFFCPTDAKPVKTTERKELSKTMLGFTELYQKLDASNVGVKLLLVDACRNEPVDFRGLDGEAEPRPSKGTAALFSCTSGERSYEKEELKHGIFFHFVLEGLKGKARNEDNEITWDDLSRYVRRQVSRESPKLISGGGRQTPHEISNLEGASPVLRAIDGASARTKEDSKRAEAGKERPQEVKNSLGMTLVRIPQGKFLMGSPPGEKERRDDETQHEVEITKEFWLGVHEVTQGQFKAIMGYNPSYFSRDGEGKNGLEYDSFKPAGGKAKVAGMDTSDFPVENVSYEEAVLFCKTLSAQPPEKGQRYRLPREAEWEYACRGGARTSTPFQTGNALTSTQANFSRTLGRPCKVGSYPANGFGLYDMHGNVWEWCHDVYDRDYYRKSPRLDPPGPTGRGPRVSRGGNWGRPAENCRSANRARFRPLTRRNGLGFRVALDLSR